MCTFQDASHKVSYFKAGLLLNKYSEIDILKTSFSEADILHNSRFHKMTLSTYFSTANILHSKYYKADII